MWKTGRYDFGMGLCAAPRTASFTVAAEDVVRFVGGSVQERVFWVLGGLRWRDIGAGCEGLLGVAFLMVGFGGGRGKVLGVEEVQR